MKIAFSLALVSFVESTLALRLAATTLDSQFAECNVIYQGEIRPASETNYAFAYQWIEGNKEFGRTEEIVYGELVMRYCDDLTIRNQNNQCLTRTESSNNYNIIAPCEVDNDNQQFVEESQQDVTDTAGFAESSVVYRNKGSQQCLSMMGDSNDTDCVDGVMFRNKGPVYKNGSLQNVGTKMCLEPVEIEAEVQVTSAACSEDTNQNFTIFENGEMIHDNSGLCLGSMEGQTNGIIVLYYCGDSFLQAWYGELNQESDAYYVKNNADGQYLESDAVGDFITKSAFAGVDFQQWRVISSEEWAIPEFQWISVGCDSGVDTTHMYTQSMYMEDKDEQQISITDEAVESFKNAMLEMTFIDNFTPVASTAVPEVYTTLSEMMWHPSDPYVDKQHAFNCGEFEDGTPSETGGCLWRSLITAHNYFSNEDLSWHTPLTKCTVAAEPLCPPLTHCIDSGCSECVLSGYSAPQ